MLITAPAFAQMQSGTLEEIQVIGTRATLANSVAKQRASDKTSSVIDSDGAGNFPDINVAESLRRLPGISLENDQGEGRYVTVRGMNTDLNAMTINGVSTASPENRRGIMLDGVPTDLLETMTVYKTLTPNLDADTIGGSIDLETVSAFKYDDSHVRLRAESSYNEQTDDAKNPKLSLLATNRWRFDEGEFGAALTVSHQERRIVSYNNETGAFWGTPNGGPLNSDYEMRYYDINRKRQGVSLNLDYRADSGNSYYARMLYNKYREEEYRAKWEIRRAIEADLDDIDVDGNVFTYPFQRVDTEARPRIENRSIASGLAGAEFIIADDVKLTAEVFGSKADQEDDNKWNAIFRSAQLNVPLTFDISNPRKPVLNYDQSFYDPATFELNTMETEFAITKDKDIGAKLDLSHALGSATEMQYGVKYRARSKDNDFDFCGYDPEVDSTLADYPNETPGAYFGNTHGPAPTYDGTRALGETISNGSLTRLLDGTTCPTPTADWSFSGDEDEVSIPGDWYSDEDVSSLYAMATTELDATSLVYGLRYEHTKARFEGKQYDGDNFEPVVFRKSYGFLAPSLNVKHLLSNDMQLRFGVYRSMVRPGFGESAAGAEINVDDNEISGGNPDLDPTRAWSVDLGLEWYAGPETSFSAGIFHKRISDAIVRIEAENLVTRGQTWDSGTTFVNIADTSNLWGAEFSYQTVFSSGFLFTINYTLTDGNMTLPAGVVSVEDPVANETERKIPFFKQAKHTLNASVGYDSGPWDVRLSANYRDRYLDIIGGNALDDRYTNDFLQLDLKGKYEINDNLTVTGGVINLNDRPEYYYFGNKQRLSQYDEFGRTYELGLTYTF